MLVAMIWEPETLAFRSEARELRVAGEIALGQGNGEGEVFNGQLKAVEQRQGQQEVRGFFPGFLFGGLSGFLVGFRGHFYDLGQGVADLNGGLANVVPGNAAEVHVQDVAVAGDGGVEIVQGHVFCTQGQRKIKGASGLLHPQIDAHVHGGVAVVVHGDLDIHPAGGALRLGRRNQTPQEHNTEPKRKKNRKQPLQGEASFASMINIPQRRGSSVLSCINQTRMAKAFPLGQAHCPRFTDDFCRFSLILSYLPPECKGKTQEEKPGSFKKIKKLGEDIWGKLCYTI